MFLLFKYGLSAEAGLPTFVGCPGPHRTTLAKDEWCGQTLNTKPDIGSFKIEVNLWLGNDMAQVLVRCTLEASLFPGRFMSEC